MYEFFPKFRDGQQYRFLAVADKHPNIFKFNLHYGFLTTPPANAGSSVVVTSDKKTITFKITPALQISRDAIGTIFLGFTPIFNQSLPKSVSPKSMWKSLWVSDDKWDLRLEFLDGICIEIERDFIRILQNGVEVPLMNV